MTRDQGYQLPPPPNLQPDPSAGIWVHIRKFWSRESTCSDGSKYIDCLKSVLVLSLDAGQLSIDHVSITYIYMYTEIK